MAEYRLTWLEGRSTPVVRRVGGKRPKTAGGKVIASRLANEQEKRDIQAGRWVRSRPPGQPNKKSSIRPQLAAKQKDGDGLWANIKAKRERIKRGAKERKARPGEKGYPNSKALKAAQVKDPA